LKNKLGAVLAWTLFVIVTFTSVLGLVRQLAELLPGHNLFDLVDMLLGQLLGIAFAFPAALIISQRSKNVIGWLVMIPALLFPIDFLVSGYLDQFPVAPADSPGILLPTVVFNNLIWLFLIFPIFFIMLLFPDGRPPSPRWRWLVVTGLGIFAFPVGFFGFASPTIYMLENSEWGTLPNPIGFLSPGVEFPDTFWFASLLLLTLFCFAAPVVRYRRAAGMVRQQMKWLFYSCALFATLYSGSLAFDLLQTSGLFEILYMLSIIGIPLTIAIAILRYQLYDINVIIRKTILYGVLTVLLATVYFGGVVVFQTLFEAISGEQSPLAIVISTLLIAALVSPLRRRLQREIDRRFFRQKYDAQLVLTQFAETARSEVGLERLAKELVQVANETVQPESVSIWLKQ